MGLKVPREEGTGYSGGRPVATGKRAEECGAPIRPGGRLL